MEQVKKVPISIGSSGSVETEYDEIILTKNNMENKTPKTSETKTLNITDVSVCLNEGQLAFIEQCKKNGMDGCSITVNNQQTWVSFTNEH